MIFAHRVLESLAGLMHIMGIRPRRAEEGPHMTIKRL